VIVFNRRRVQQMDPPQFARACHELHAELLAKGWHDKNELPPYYLAKYLVLEEEYARRGSQLRLFNDYD
jgi:hypothetical protein